MGFRNYSAAAINVLSATPLLLFLLLLPAESSSSYNNHDGFTVELIHRDSPKSPLYDPSHSLYELVKRAHERSTKRKKSFSSTTGVVPNEGEYLMEISYGTPPFKTFAIADSGSDLSWIQCKPCLFCFHQDTSPIFNPQNSSSYKLLVCTTETCKKNFGYCEILGINQTAPNPNPCKYDMTYADGSDTHGNLATETITFGGSTTDGERSAASSFSNFVFGCGHDNEGKFSNKSSGLVGLGFGNQSIITQLDFAINGKFSYCLGPFTDPTKSGKLSFGREALVTGNGVVSTPLILDTYYYLILEGASVGSERLKYKYSSPPNEPLKGNIIIDSGTTTTYLPEQLYREVESAVRSKINKSVKSVEDPLNFFGLCYQGLNETEIPKITLHFKGGDLELKALNTVVATSDTVKCLCFAPASSSDIPIIGNIAQNNVWVGYDLQKKTLSFLRTDCTQH